MDRLSWVGRGLARGVSSRYRGYVIGAATMAALVVARRWIFAESFNQGPPLRLFILPVLAAAYSGGLWPGLVMTALGSVVAPSFFADPSGSFDWQTTLTYITVGLIVSGFMESLHVTRRRLEERQRELE